MGMGGMGNHLSVNGNYLHSQGNLFPKVLCCDELIKYLPDANAYCAEFANYRNVIYSAPRACGSVRFYYSDNK